MTDEECLFRQTERERKRLGYGDKHKKRGGGRYVRLPSDNLSKKEREALNGETKSYHMEKPVEWKVFKKWPEDLQRAYLLGLREKFNMIDVEIAEMFGCSRNSVSFLKKRLGIANGKYKREKLREAEWKAFLNGDPMEPKLPEVEVVTLEETRPDYKPETETVEPVEAEEIEEKPRNLENIGALIQALRGTGARLTIEVTL